MKAREIRVVIACVVLAVLIGVVSPGCNTIRGLGKDIEKAGEAVGRAAD